MMPYSWFGAATCICVQRLLNDVKWVTLIPLFSVGSTESDDVTSVATEVAENVL